MISEVLEIVSIQPVLVPGMVTSSSFRTSEPGLVVYSWLNFLSKQPLKDTVPDFVDGLVDGLWTLMDNVAHACFSFFVVGVLWALFRASHYRSYQKSGTSAT